MRKVEDYRRKERERREDIEKELETEESRNEFHVSSDEVLWRNFYIDRP